MTAFSFTDATGQPRPVRLSEATRRFAADSLAHKYGLDTRACDALPMDHIPGFGEMDAFDRYDTALRELVQTVPLRICEGEMISGAANLGYGIDGRFPATFEGKTICNGLDHLTVDFPRLLRLGFTGIREEIERSLTAPHTAREQRFLRSGLATVESFAIWNRRYVEALSKMEGYESNAAAMAQVPMLPPRSFREALQSIWSGFAFLRLLGNWPGIGRLDDMLEPYLQADLASGSITLKEARELLAHFFIKGCEWNVGGNYGSGDAQHYQNIVLAGHGNDGREITGDTTYLILEVLEELGISDFPTTVRLHRESDPALIRRTAEVIRLGGGVVAVYNEDLILAAMEDCGYTRENALRFANDGCWEVQVPGETFFLYAPFDGLRLLQQKTLRGYGEGCDYPDFEGLMQAFREDLRGQVAAIRDRLQANWFVPAEDGGFRWRENIPCTALSLLIDGCIEKGRSYLEGGPRYNVYAMHIGGLPDLANALYAIRRLVYEEGRCSLPGLLAILKNNWEGEEPLRQYILSHYPSFGNDDPGVDGIASTLVGYFAEACAAVEGSIPFAMPAGVSTFGRQIEWAPYRMATPDGHKQGELLSGNFSPAPGSAVEGATAIIRSYCGCDLRRLPNGAALDLPLLPSSVEGEEGIAAMEGLLRGFLALGGFFLQMDVADVATLRDAQEHPENYGSLSVRVSGWNARFVTLNREWQNMIIDRLEHHA